MFLKLLAVVSITWRGCWILTNASFNWEILSIVFVSSRFNISFSSSTALIWACVIAGKLHKTSGVKILLSSSNSPFINASTSKGNNWGLISAFSNPII